MFSINNTGARPVAIANEAVVREYLEGMSRLNMGFPNGRNLSLDPSSPIGCAQTNGRFGSKIVCLIGADGAYEFSFGLRWVHSHNGQAWLEGNLGYTHIFGGPSGSHHAVCKVEPQEETP